MRLLLTLTVLLYAVPARAAFETFIGWSPDGSLYATTGETEGGFFAALCMSEPKAGAPSWPKDLARPDKGEACAALCDDCDRGRDRARAVKLTGTKKIEKQGARGEAWSVKRGAGDAEPEAIVTLSLAGQSYTYHVPIAHPQATLKLTEIAWRPDGGAVSFALDTNTANDGHGFKDDRYVYVGVLPNAAAKIEKTTAAATVKSPPLGEVLRGAGKDLAGLRAAMADELRVETTDPETGKPTQTKKISKAKVDKKVFEETFKYLFIDLLEGGGELECKESKLVCTVTSNSGAAITYRFVSTPSGNRLSAISAPSGE